MSRERWSSGWERLTAAERECDQLRAEVLRLRQALANAVDGMDDMIEYVPDYFRVKWGHDAFLERGRAALVGGVEPTAGASSDRRRTEER